MAVCLSVQFLVSLGRLEKRSRALRGRNLTRNIQADGAPTVYLVPDGSGRQGPFYSWHRQPESCLRKSDRIADDAP